MQASAIKSMQFETNAGKTGHTLWKIKQSQKETPERTNYKPSFLVGGFIVVFEVKIWR